MFAHAIKQLPLTDSIADTYFANIRADYYEGDESFCATLRALLFDRVEMGGLCEVKLAFGARDESVLPYDFSSRREILFIKSFKGFTEDEFDDIVKDSRRILASFFHYTDVSVYLTQAGCKSYVYIDEVRRQTLVLVHDLNLRYWHKMQSALPKLLPWHFRAPLKPEESKLLRTLTLKTSKAYIDAILTFASKHDFRKERLSLLLKDYGLAFEKKHLETLLNNRRTQSERFSHLQAEIAKCIACDRKLVTEIIGVENAIANGDKTGLVNYFAHNKCLNLVQVKDVRLSFVVTTYLEYFDQTMFNKVFANPKSYLYETSVPLVHDMEWYKALLSALYGDDIRIKARVCAEFALSQEGTLTPVSQSRNLKTYLDWLPNPHIDGANCLGTNATYINQLMKGRKYIEAIEQAVAATKNINFADAAIAPRFVVALRSSDLKFLELPTGEVVSPSEAIVWLKEGVSCH